MLVVIESPFAGKVKRNLAYARLCLLDSLTRGESPIASHLLYTQVLDDKRRLQRVAGIDAGYDWMDAADKVILYRDFGLSSGMVKARTRAHDLCIPVENRYLHKSTAIGNAYTEREKEVSLGLCYHWWHRWTRASQSPFSNMGYIDALLSLRPERNLIPRPKILDEIPEGAFINQTLSPDNTVRAHPYGEQSE